MARNKCWTAREDALLAKLYAEGMSQTEIAGRISLAYGVRRTRYAVNWRRHWRQIPTHVRLIWPPARVALMWRLLRAGTTPTQIARQLNTTRNAIVGKAWRTREQFQPDPPRIAWLDRPLPWERKHA